MENNIQSMYLSTIPNNKKPIIQKPSSLDISDIAGTRSRYIQHPRPQRNTNTKLNSFDIQKTQPKQLIPEIVNRPNYCLEIDDIVGTRTKIGKFTTTRNTNPLVPEYQNPTVVYLPPEEPKFIKDSLAIDDIEGVRNKQTFILKLQRANKTINTKEELIKTIKPTPKGFLRTNNTNDSLKVEDINQGDIQYANKHKRQTNPLQPVYNISGDKTYGSIQGTKINPYTKSLRVNNSLKTQDIEGSKVKINNFICNKKDEIVGSKPESLKRGVSSNRQTNPLQPKYNYPGWSQVSNNCHFTRPKTAAQRFDQFIK